MQKMKKIPEKRSMHYCQGLCFSIVPYHNQLGPHNKTELYGHREFPSSYLLDNIYWSFCTNQPIVWSR